jgi:rsbT co-antagonist protein RsbR
VSSNISSEETARLAALEQFAILDTAPEPVFDDLVQLAAQLCDAPLALLTFVAGDRQWFKSRLGIEAAEAPRGALCEAALRQTSVFEVADARAHSDFAQDPLVAGPPHACWYAAAPLRTEDGHVLGALAVLDRAPRELSANQRAALQALGHQTMAVLALRRRAAELEQRATAQERDNLQLREHEQLFRTIAGSVPLPILISSVADGSILYANKAFGTLLGSPVEPLIGQRTPDFYYDPSDREALLQQLRRDGSVHNYDLHIKTVQDDSRWVLASVQLMRYDDQPALLSALNDVTEYKQAEEALHESQHLMRLVMDNIPLSICWKDRNSIFLGCNRHCADNVGLDDPAAIVGKSDDDLTTAELAAQYRADDRQVMESGVPKLHFEEQLLHPNGEYSWLRTDKLPLRDRADKVIGILVMFEDTTAYKHAEEERSRLKDDLIRAQAMALEELSTPLIPISDNTVVMPLIGTIDSRRSQQVLEALLNGVSETRTEVAILDITGVPVVDTQVANALISAAQAVRLLGAQVVLTGIRPEVAQTLVGLGVDLTGIVTHSTLQTGIAFALRHK